MYAQKHSFRVQQLGEILQAVFAIWQLQGTIGKHFKDATLQIENAKRGAIHSHAGTGTYVTVSILERE